MAGDMTHTLTPDLGTPVISCSKTFNLFHELSIFELKPVESSSSVHDSNVICLEGGGKKSARGRCMKASMCMSKKEREYVMISYT
jgi:hypothetical protein